jgi:glycosyltransferase involved in cell wall biosynthesis
MIKPIITIGITTYNRLNYLRDLLRSLVKNNYEIEILVGNDYQSDIIDVNKIGVFDSRIRIINHPENLGELENMNSLLGQARGEYFTWIFDDDPVSIYLIENIVRAITENENVKCIYTNYKKLVSKDSYFDNNKYSYNAINYSGNDFLRNYFRGDLRVLGCLGFYKTSYLKQLGGAAKLSSGKFALHAEYDLIIKSGLLDRIIYIDAPLVTTRVHDNSWTISNINYKLFSEAGINLIKNNIDILMSENLKKDFYSNFQKLLDFVIGSIVVRGYSSNSSVQSKFLEILFTEINNISDGIKDRFFKQLIELSVKETRKKVLLFKIKGILKKIMPLWVLRFRK